MYILTLPKLIPGLSLDVLAGRSQWNVRFGDLSLLSFILVQKRHAVVVFFFDKRSRRNTCKRYYRIKVTTQFSPVNSREIVKWTIAAYFFHPHLFTKFMERAPCGSENRLSKCKKKRPKQSKKHNEPSLFKGMNGFLFFTKSPFSLFFFCV